RRGSHTGVEAAGAKDGVQKGGRRPLAVGAGDQRPPLSALGMAKLVEDRVHPLEPELYSEAPEARHIVERRIVRQPGLRACSACQVLAITIARVTGPTPPGTGVSQPATPATLGSTSPPSLPPGRVLIPTSITTAPVRTMPGLTKSS